MDSRSSTFLESRLIAAIGLIVLSVATGACGDPGATPEDPESPDRTDRTDGPDRPSFVPEDRPEPGPDNPVGPDTTFGVLHGAAPIAGVHYQTDTHQGLTDEQVAQHLADIADDIDTLHRAHGGHGLVVREFEVHDHARRRKGVMS